MLPYGLTDLSDLDPLCTSALQKNYASLEKRLNVQVNCCYRKHLGRYIISGWCLARALPQKVARTLQPFLICMHKGNFQTTSESGS